MLPELKDKNADIERISKKSLADKKLLSELLDGLKSKDETFRYNCYKVLMFISKTNGEVLYPSWDYFVELLHSDNSYHKMSAVHLLTNLLKVDKEDRFQKIFDTYYNLLDDKSVIVAVYVAQNSAQIVRAKPQLENRITNILLNIDKTHHPSGRKELIKAGVIEAFIEYLPDSKNKAKILEFVTKQQDSESPKTRKITKSFMQKWNNN
jgi:hypothetical protein